MRMLDQALAFEGITRWVTEEKVKYADYEEIRDEYEQNHKAGIYDGLAMVEREIARMIERSES